MSLLIVMSGKGSGDAYKVSVVEVPENEVEQYIEKNRVHSKYWTHVERYTLGEEIETNYQYCFG